MGLKPQHQLHIGSWMKYKVASEWVKELPFGGGAWKINITG